MGSWNHTCMLSRLHIHAGEPVVSLFCEQSYFEPSYCESNSIFSPYPFLLFGQYDDYGGVENIHERPTNELFRSHMRQRLEVDVVESDIVSDWNTLYRVDQDNSLKAKSYVRGEGDRLIKHVVIKRDLFDRVVETHTVHDYFGGNITYGSLVADLPRQLQEIKQAFDDLLFPSLETQLLNLNPAHPILEAVRTIRFANHILQSSLYRLLDGEAGVSLAQVEAFLDDLAKLYIVNDLVSETRTPWQPTVGQGSQSSTHEGYRLLTSYINDALDAEQAELDADLIVE